jgi:hypothetical protein
MTKTPLVALVLAAVGLAACGGERKQSQAQTRAADTPEPQLTVPVPPPLLDLLPAGNGVPGWAASGAPRGFTPDTLFELIDGAADGFIAYGVQAVVAADYKQAGTGYEATIEVYEMKDPLNAFGKYSEERGPEYQYLRVGNEGYSGGTTVNFWSGQYYVKITAFEEKDEIAQEMIKLAKAIAARVTAPGAEPREFSWFPKENQLPRTAKYIPKDVLAQSYFTNGFEVRYKAGTKESRLVSIGMLSVADAAEALNRYRGAVAKGGKGLADIAAPGEGGFAGTDSFYGNLVAVRAGKHVAVALGATSEAAGKKQLADLVRNMK